MRGRSDRASTTTDPGQSPHIRGAGRVSGSAGGDTMLTAIVGINWGDEGKGRMVDLLSSSYDVVVRYQGGNNADTR